MKLFDKKIILGICITFLFILSIFSMFIQKEDNSLSITSKEDYFEQSFAIMLEQDDGTYIESNSKTWPSNGYSYNAEMSKCLDINGNVLPGSLFFDTENNVAEFETNTTSTCYLYFDIVE